MRLILAALLLLAAPQEAPKEAQAKELYQAGTIEFDLGHFKEALGKWEAAYRLKPVPAALFNMGQAYWRLGQLEEAARAFKRPARWRRRSSG